MNRSIKLLDDNTINKIAAGEVVERPSSVIKELLENSVDADSTSITIEIINGGKSYIRVTDNGVGINREDVELAFLRHSTSKISRAEDLTCIETLGFRGEALASISAVSQVELISKTSEDESGVKAIVHGGILKSKEEIGCPNGTTIIIKNLFYNTPVRQKFLKSDNTEATHIGDIVYKLAISNPNISFSYIKDNKPVIKTPGRGDLEATAYSVLGRDFVDSTFEISNSCDGMSLYGLIGKPEYTRSSRNSQYLFINGRYIKDNGISKTVEQSYNTLITVNRLPVFLLFIKVDTEKVDINVHPTKTEVRFKNRSIINEFIRESINKVLYSENLIPKMMFLDNSSVKSKVEAKKQLDNQTQTTLDSIDNQNNASQINLNLNKDSEFLKVIDFSNLSTEENASKFKSMKVKSPKENNIKKKNDIKDIKKDTNNTLDDKPRVSEKTYISYNEASIKRVPDITIVGVLFKTYILGQDLEGKRFYMIDQHAAHERIMYEKLKDQFLSQDVKTQILLATDVLELSLSEMDLIKNHLDVFSDLGFEIEEFGSNTIALRGVPLVFGKPDSKKLFLDILDNLENSPNSSYELQLEKIMKRACTAAIKANDKLQDIEVKRLVEDLILTKEPFTCPHGRPIIIEMTKGEIEKRFKRT